VHRHACETQVRGPCSERRNKPGSPLEARNFGNGWPLGNEASIVQGLSPVLVKETAETLVLSKKDLEVLRRPLRLDPDRRTTLRP